MEIQPFSRDEKAVQEITKYIELERSNLYKERDCREFLKLYEGENKFCEKSKQILLDLWKSFQLTSENKYDLIEQQIITTFKFGDEMIWKVSNKSYDSFMCGFYVLLEMSGIDERKNNILHYHSFINDFFEEREPRLSEACEDELERRMEEIKTLDQWKPGESIIFEVELRKKGELPE